MSEFILIKCRKKKVVQVCKSAAGYYIGTMDEDGPNCRLSEEYYPSFDEAQEALNNKTYTERDCKENNFCRGNIGKCF